MQRQYTGTAGRIENAQVGRLPGLRQRAGHALIDRELYLPRGLDRATRDRCAAAGVPDRDRVRDQAGAGHGHDLPARWTPACPAAWVTGDEVYGADPGLRAELETRGIGYVLAVACDHRVAVAAGDSYRADALLRRVPARAWQRLSAGTGAKGHRYYDWAFIRLDHGDPSPGGQAAALAAGPPQPHAPASSPSTAAGRPDPVPLAALVRVAGRRWTIEERFQTAKGLVGLDQHQVRRWRSWYRWTTLAMLAHAFLVVPPPPNAPATRHRPG